MFGSVFPAPEREGLAGERNVATAPMPGPSRPRRTPDDGPPIDPFVRGPLTTAAAGPALAPIVLAGANQRPAAPPTLGQSLPRSAGAKGFAAAAGCFTRRRCGKA